MFLLRIYDLDGNLPLRLISPQDIISGVLLTLGLSAVLLRENWDTGSREIIRDTQRDITFFDNFRLQNLPLCLRHHTKNLTLLFNYVFACAASTKN